MARRWRDEQTATFLRLAAAGRSAKEIALYMTTENGIDYSRQMVAAKARRMYISLASAGKIGRPATKRSDQRAILRAATTHVHFIDRGSRQCVFPLWSDDERIGAVCGAAKARDVPYCDQHMDLCWSGRSVWRL